MTQPPSEFTLPSSDTLDLRGIVDDVMDVQDTTYGSAPGIAVRFRGRLRLASEEAYRIVAERFRDRGYTALFRRDKGAGESDTSILAAIGLPNTASRLWLALALFAVTFLSVLYIGALNEIPDFLQALLRIGQGLPFALSLMAILVCHEMGHFVAGKLLGMPMSFPFFIPLPLPPLGTMGAVIQMKAPPVNRRSMLIVGAAGPIAGLLVALPLLLLGFSMSRVMPLDPNQPVFMEGNSLLYLALKFLWFGKVLPGGGEDVLIHAVAFAGWTGLLLTALNLIPVGQLDGGHIVNALFGDRVAWVRWPIIVILGVLGLPAWVDIMTGSQGSWLSSFSWGGWLLWAGLLFVFGGIRAQPLDDITRLRPWHWALGLVMIAIFILTFVPIPFAVWGG